MDGYRLSASSKSRRSPGSRESDCGQTFIGYRRDNHPKESQRKEGLAMGEAKRKAQHQTKRTWATGKLRMEANDVHCFDWIGTRQDAVDLQRRYLDVVNSMGIDAKSYAARAAGYLMAFGMPTVGEPDRRPSNFGNPWDRANIELYRAAVLWSALREHVPDTGQRLEDVFVGKSLLVVFIGDKKEILDDTVRELKGQPFSDGHFTMTAAVIENYKLDPDKAVCMQMRDLLALAGRTCPDGLRDDLIYVPRIPLDATEAKAMLQMMTVGLDLTKPVANPEDAIRHYAGYTDDELRRDRPAVIVR
jgi:hypothetical protein